uniref:Uncharacterized protein n=1 Tax=Romanomermis culicivorax TaxID=13658 RepID=A0A915J834_ROMCU
MNAITLCKKLSRLGNYPKDEKMPSSQMPVYVVIYFWREIGPSFTKQEKMQVEEVQTSPEKLLAKMGFRKCNQPVIRLEITVDCFLQNILSGRKWNGTKVQAEHFKPLTICSVSLEEASIKDPLACETIVLQNIPKLATTCSVGHLFCGIFGTEEEYGAAFDFDEEYTVKAMYKFFANVA